MKVRESGMPDEKTWNVFFDIDSILSELQINGQVVNDMVEVGCGYGTLTIPAAKQITGRLYAFDIEKGMIDILEQKIKHERIDNILPQHRDVLTRHIVWQNITHGNGSKNNRIDPWGGWHSYFMGSRYRGCGLALLAILNAVRIQRMKV